MKKHSFCYFKPTKPGKILDLSYNDMTLRNAKNILNVLSGRYDTEVS